jgi:hypothetical protein
VTSAGVTVLQYGVHDIGYPRNARVRRFLESLPGVTVRVAPRSRAGHRLRRAADDLRALWCGSRGADVLLLSEMRLTHAPLVRLVGWLRHARVVVDGFIGLHETAVGDWGSTSSTSFRAARFALQDRLALASADLYLIDTPVRAAAVSQRASGSRPVLALPVGAPAWARFTPAEASDDLRILYYGNYLPLHGTELVVEALARLAPHRSFHATFVGGGARRPAIQEAVRRAGISGRCTFLDPVPEERLPSLVAETDVVLGVFGSSAKARTVVANKVWQGIASGRFVVTQDGPALAEVRVLADGLLLTTEPGSADSLCDVLAAVDPGSLPRSAATCSDRVEEHVSAAYEALGRWILRDGSHP